jgi:hypothetical protein
MLRPGRTVRVTTKEELVAALAAADQIIVEGRDTALLAYAEGVEGLPVEVAKLSLLDRPILGTRSNKIIAEEHFRARLEKEQRWRTIITATAIVVALLTIGGLIG